MSNYKYAQKYAIKAYKIFHHYIFPVTFFSSYQWTDIHVEETEKGKSRRVVSREN